MVKNYLLFIFVLISSASFNAQEIQLLSESASSNVLQQNVPTYIQKTKIVNGTEYHDFSTLSSVFTMEAGMPAMPMYTESLNIAASGVPTIEVTFDSYTEYQNVSVLPSKGSLKRNVSPADIAYEFGSTYSQNAFYPGQIAKAGNPFIFRNTRGITVSFFPYQYNPVTKVLRVYKNISVHVTVNPAIAGDNELSLSKEEKSEEYKAMYRNLYANMPAYLPLQDEGELLIITPSSYLPSLQPMIDWKVERGIKTTVVTLDQTGSDPISIKSYITSFFAANPNLVYIQLVGDHEQLPTFSYGTTGANEELYSDSYYGQILGTDLFPELMVGRLSGTISDVEAMVQKVVEYETAPADGDWMIKAAGIGSNEGMGFGDDGEADWQHLRNIGDKLTAYGYNQIYEFYDGAHGINDLSGSPTAGSISEALNSGVGILNYTGHGATEIMSTGSYSSNNVYSLLNAGQYPFVISVACNNGTFVGGNSLCEVFTTVRQSSDNSPAGAIASCGSSILMAWSEPMQTQDEMAELITRSDLSNNKTTLGGLFYNGQISMLEDYDQSNTAEEVMQTWIFFGDPSVTFRSAVPTAIYASHEEEISISGADIHIASNTSDALVSITQNNILVGNGFTVDGLATITIPTLLTEDLLKVTIVKQNTIPYRGSVNVSSSLGVNTSDKMFAVYPNPASEALFIKNIGNAMGDATVKLIDSNGRIIFEKTNVSFSEDYSLPVSGLSSGIYILSVNGQNFNEIKKIAIH
jgi:gingipain R